MDWDERRECEIDATDADKCPASSGLLQQSSGGGSLVEDMAIVFVVAFRDDVGRPK